MNGVLQLLIVFVGGLVVIPMLALGAHILLMPRDEWKSGRRKPTLRSE